MTNTISKEYGKHAVIFLERLLFVTNEMLVSVNDKDLDKLENLITQRESLIDLAMAQKDTLIKTAQHARDKAG
ncbi:MAG: hypothetical protein KGZ58_03055, partial [Ignavibacteriales bacterium]|nr:hypothetical protein [Ignavibacteriales bacterium]